jgi:hypothetical protein
MLFNPQCALSALCLAGTQALEKFTQAAKMTGFVRAGFCD